MKNPCHGCENRTVGCHINCELYLSWKKENDARKEHLKKVKSLEYDFLPSYRRRR